MDLLDKIDMMVGGKEEVETNEMFGKKKEKPFVGDPDRIKDNRKKGQTDRKKK